MRRTRPSRSARCCRSPAPDRISACRTSRASSSRSSWSTRRASTATSSRSNTRTRAAARCRQYRPDVVIGEECSDATLAIMPLMAEAKVPLLNAGSSSIKITEPGNPWTFRIMPNEVMQGVDIATNAYKRLNARTAVLLYENTNAGIGNAKVFNDTFTKLGGKILADIGFGRDVNDFTAIATRLAGLGPVDVIPTYTLEGQGLKITQAVAQAGVTKGGG